MYGNQSTGYWRGSDIQAGGSGSGMGSQPGGSAGLSQGLGSMGPGNWHPTVLYMLGLIVAEMVVFGVIGRMLK